MCYGWISYFYVVLHEAWMGKCQVDNEYSQLRLIQKLLTNTCSNESHINFNSFDFFFLRRHIDHGQSTGSHKKFRLRSSYERRYPLWKDLFY